MSSWPVAPIIHIAKGCAFGGRHIRDEYALRTADGAYVIDGGRLENSVDFDSGDRIDSWEEVVPVPAKALKSLREEFRGDPVSERRLSALLLVTPYAAPKSEYPLDRAVPGEVGGTDLADDPARRPLRGVSGPAVSEPGRGRTMSNSHKIAAKLEDYLDCGYFAGMIMDVYTMINHIHFLEQKVASLRATIARMQSNTAENV